jgi:hypothetical protein
MAKQDNTIWWVLGVIVVVIILVTGGIGIFSGKNKYTSLEQFRTNCIQSQGKIESYETGIRPQVVDNSCICPEMSCAGYTGINCPTGFTCVLENPNMKDGMGRCWRDNPQPTVWNNKMRFLGCGVMEAQ